MEADSNDVGSDRAGREQALRARNRLVAAILRFAADELPLARLENHSAVFGVANTGAPVAVIAHSGEPPSALADRLVGVAQAQPGTLYLVIAGGDEAEVKRALEDVAKRAPDLRSLGLYQATDDGRLLHVDGRRLGALESAGKKLPEVDPPTAEELRALAEQSQRQHVEAVEFSRKTRRFPVVSLVLGAVCVLIFLRGGAPGSGALADAIVVAGANIGQLVREGEWWRLLSSAFLHGSQGHLLVNMLSLYFLGTFLEQLVGRSRYMLIYGLSALGGSVASALLSSVSSVGASGAIWGLMTAGLGLSLRPGSLLPAVVASRIRRSLMTPLVLNIAITLLPDLVGAGVRIDKWAHFGGGAVGLAIGYSGWLGNKRNADDGSVAAVNRGQPVPAPRLVHVGAVIVALAMVGCLAWVLWQAQALMAHPGFRPTGTAGPL